MDNERNNLNLLANTVRQMNRGGFVHSDVNNLLNQLSVRVEQAEEELQKEQRLAAQNATSSYQHHHQQQLLIIGN